MFDEDELLSSFSLQMEPFSPILYETSLGSTHNVSSSGSFKSSYFATPLAWAASAMMGSQLWLILIQRYPLPNKGFWGCQWCLYLAHKSSSSLVLNASICFSVMFRFCLIRVETKPQASRTSVSIVWFLGFRNLSSQKISLRSTPVQSSFHWFVWFSLSITFNVFLFPQDPLSISFSDGQTVKLIQDLHNNHLLKRPETFSQNNYLLYAIAEIELLQESRIIFFCCYHNRLVTSPCLFTVYQSAARACQTIQGC